MTRAKAGLRQKSMRAKVGLRQKLTKAILKLIRANQKLTRAKVGLRQKKRASLKLARKSPKLTKAKVDPRQNSTKVSQKLTRVSPEIKVVLSPEVIAKADKVKVLKGSERVKTHKTQGLVKRKVRGIVKINKGIGRVKIQGVLGQAKAPDKDKTNNKMPDRVRI